MRVLVRPTPRDEHGATAVLVALMAAFVLFPLSALVVDAGQAYTNKRQLQNAADAGALAAVQVYRDADGSACQMAADPALEAAARSAAEAVGDDDPQEDNSVDRQVGTLDFQVDCITSGTYKGALQATYAVGRSTTSFFSEGGDIEASADANAVMFVPGAAEKFRPYGLCAADVPDADDMPSSVVEIASPGQAAGRSGCPSAETSGNWWFMNCPGAPNGGMNPTEVAQVLTDGCANPAETVKPQNPSSPASLSASLTVNCNDQADVSTSCLDAETGNADLKNRTPVAAWNTLLGSTIIVPVFCAQPTCDPSTVDGNGTGNVYPVYTFTAVTVCGFHFYSVRDGQKMSNTGDCAGNAYAPPAKASDYVEKLGCRNDNDPCLPVYDEDGNPTGDMEKPKDTVRLWLKFNKLVGGLKTPSGCELGGGCDGGLRQYALNE
jgi:hypothetical protein